MSMQVFDGVSSDDECNSDGSDQEEQEEQEEKEKEEEEDKPTQTQVNMRAIITAITQSISNSIIAITLVGGSHFRSSGDNTSVIGKREHRR